jgi:hypothetical protein
MVGGEIIIDGIKGAGRTVRECDRQSEQSSAAGRECSTGPEVVRELNGRFLHDTLWY